MNAVAMNPAALRYLDQQQIQLFERLGHRDASMRAKLIVARSSNAFAMRRAT